MSSIRVNFIGRLGADAEVRTAPNGSEYMTFRVAVDEWNGHEEVTTWMSVSADMVRFQSKKEILKKGRLVNVCGVEKCSIYTTKDGQNSIERRVFLESIELVPIGQKSDNNNSSQTPQVTTGTLKSNSQVAEKPAPKPTVEAPSDDLPF